MSDQTAPLSLPQKQGLLSIPVEIRTEIIRKTIHMFIAFVPLCAQTFGRLVTVSLLLAGVLFYTIAESFRCHGKNVPVISLLTRLSSRQRDMGHFVLAPVTLGLGAVLALALYPEPAASVAIYALAFGDGLSSLFGKIFGTVTVPFSDGKSVEGSIACFIAVFLSSFVVLQNALSAFLVAVFTTVLEIFPTKDFDNLILPTGVGLFTLILLA